MVSNPGFGAPSNGFPQQGGGVAIPGLTPTTDVNTLIGLVGQQSTQLQQYQAQQLQQQQIQQYLQLQQQLQQQQQQLLQQQQIIQQQQQQLAQQQAQQQAQGAQVVPGQPQVPAAGQQVPGQQVLPGQQAVPGQQVIPGQQAGQAGAQQTVPGQGQAPPNVFGIPVGDPALASVLGNLNPQDARGLAIAIAQGGVVVPGAAPGTAGSPGGTGFNISGQGFIPSANPNVILPNLNVQR